MKSMYLFLLLLVLPLFNYAQKGIGFSTMNPTESTDFNTTMRVRDLPVNNKTNAISTMSSGLVAATAKSETFIGVNTVVADVNGVLGHVQGLAVTELPDYKSIAYTANTALINDDTTIESLTSIGNLAVYFEAKQGDTGERPVRFCLLNGVDDTVIVNRLKIGSGGLSGNNVVYNSVMANPYDPNIVSLESTIPPYNSNNIDYNPSSQPTWVQIKDQKPNIGNKDYIQYIFSFLNTKEVYRLTAIVNSAITNSGVPPLVSPSRVTFFLERLTD